MPPVIIIWPSMRLHILCSIIGNGSDAGLAAARAPHIAPQSDEINHKFKATIAPMPIYGRSLLFLATQSCTTPAPVCVRLCVRLCMCVCLRERERVQCTVRAFVDVNVSFLPAFASVDENHKRKMHGKYRPRFTMQS